MIALFSNSNKWVYWAYSKQSKRIIKTKLIHCGGRASPNWILQTSIRYHWSGQLELLTQSLLCAQQWPLKWGFQVKEQVSDQQGQHQIKNSHHPAETECRSWGPSAGLHDWPFLMAELRGWTSHFSFTWQIPFCRGRDGSGLCWKWVPFQLVSRTRCFYTWTICSSLCATELGARQPWRTLRDKHIGIEKWGGENSPPPELASQWAQTARNGGMHI